MGYDLIDLAFRLGRRFGVPITKADLTLLASKHVPPDIRVGEFFDFIREQTRRYGVVDAEQDAEILWPLFQREVCDGLGVDEEGIAKDKWLLKELGGG